MRIVIVPEGAEQPSSQPVGRYSELPPPVRLEATVETQETGPRAGVDAGGDPERDFMLRYAG